MALSVGSLAGALKTPRGIHQLGFYAYYGEYYKRINYTGIPLHGGRGLVVCSVLEAAARHVEALYMTGWASAMPPRGSSPLGPLIDRSHSLLA